MNRPAAALPENGKPYVVMVSPRQYSVLRAMLFDGASNRQIAERLFLTEDTIKTHMRRIFERLVVRDRLGACIAVWSGTTDVITTNPDGSARHLLDELRQLQTSLVKEAPPCPTTTTSDSRPGTALPQRSLSSISTLVAT